MSSSKVLVLWLFLVTLACDTTSQITNRKLKKIRKTLPAMLQEGFQMAIDELNLETSVAAKFANSGSSARGFSRSRKAKFSQKQASACIGLGVRKTTRLIVDKFNLTKNESREVFESISLSSFPMPSMAKKRMCQSMPSTPPPFECDPFHPYRDINGFCNNLETHAGTAGSRFKRFLDPDYEDGTDSLRGEGRTVNPLPNPRSLSSALNALPAATTQTSHITQLVKDFGVVLDHDIIFTPVNSASDDTISGTQELLCCQDGVIIANQAEECKPIDVSNDPFYKEHGVSCLPFTRSLPAPTNTLGPREQQNDVNAFIDASNIYGSEEEESNPLRTFSRGELKDSQSHEVPSCDASFRCLFFLPETSPPSKMDYFDTGDRRVNEQLALTALHTVFVRYHNLIASTFYSINCGLSDEVIFQETRRIIGALMQKITYEDFLPIVLGENIMAQYSLKSGMGSYDASVDPSIANSFPTAAMRFGHSLITDKLIGCVPLPLTEAFFDGQKLTQPQFFPSKLLSGESEIAAEPMDWHLIDVITNQLFALGPNFTHGLDLGALNIQRGRDHGLPPYNRWRKFCKLTPFISFQNMSGSFPKPVINVFEQHYSTVDDIDLFHAGIAEYAVPGGLVGPTFACILAHQFRDLKRGDRFFYENKNQPKPFRKKQLKVISKTGLAEILCETTTISWIQPQPFFGSHIKGNGLMRCDTIKRRGVLANIKKFLGKKMKNRPPFKFDDRCRGR